MVKIIPQNKNKKAKKKKLKQTKKLTFLDHLSNQLKQLVPVKKYKKEQQKCLFQMPVVTKLEDGAGCRPDALILMHSCV